MDHDNPAGMSGEEIAGRYRLIEPLGRGAMSSVWLAQDAELGRRVAVKMLAPTRRPRPLRARGSRGRRALASEHLRALRLRRVGRPAVHGARVPAERVARRPAAERPAARRRRDDAHRDRDRRRARARARARPRPPRPEAGERPLRQRGPRQDRRLRDRAHGRRRHAHRGGHGARHRVVHLAGAGRRAARGAGERRLLVRRDPLPDAHGAAPVRRDERDGARAHAPRRPAAVGRRVPPRRAARGSSVLPTAALAKDPAARPADGAALLDGSPRRRTTAMPRSSRRCTLGAGERRGSDAGASAPAGAGRRQLAAAPRPPSQR